jgi:hypothetical protein
MTQKRVTNVERIQKAERARALANELIKRAEGCERLEFLVAVETSTINVIKKSWPEDKRHEVLTAHVRNLWTLIQKEEDHE